VQGSCRSVCKRTCAGCALTERSNSSQMASTWRVGNPFSSRPGGDAKPRRCLSRNQRLARSATGSRVRAHRESFWGRMVSAQVGIQTWE